MYGKRAISWLPSVFNFYDLAFGRNVGIFVVIVKVVPKRTKCQWYNNDDWESTLINTDTIVSWLYVSVQNGYQSACGWMFLSYKKGASCIYRPGRSNFMLVWPLQTGGLRGGSRNSREGRNGVLDSFMRAKSSAILFIIYSFCTCECKRVVCIILVPEPTNKSCKRAKSMHMRVQSEYSYITCTHIYTHK